MKHLQTIGFVVAAAVTLLAPRAGAALMALLALAPLVPPRPATRLNGGAAFVTTIVLGAGWLGVGIYQLVRHVESPLVEHLALGCALVGLGVAASRFGQADDPAPARRAAVAAFVRAGLLALLAIVLAALEVRAGRGGGQLAAMKPVLAAGQPVAGALLLGVVLQRRTALDVVRRPSWGTAAALLVAVALGVVTHERAVAPSAVPAAPR